MAKKTEKPVESVAAIDDAEKAFVEANSYDCPIPEEKAERVKELTCKPYEALCITNGNELLFFGKDVEKIVIYPRGD